MAATRDTAWGRVDGKKEWLLLLSPTTLPAPVPPSGQTQKPASKRFWEMYFAEVRHLWHRGEQKKAEDGAEGPGLKKFNYGCQMKYRIPS